LSYPPVTRGELNRRGRRPIRSIRWSRSSPNLRLSAPGDGHGLGRFRRHPSSSGPAFIAAAVDAGRERAAADDERERGYANSELAHGDSFHSLHREEGCPAAAQERANPH
jgi:hypothetical protein